MTGATKKSRYMERCYYSSAVALIPMPWQSRTRAKERIKQVCPFFCNSVRSQRRYSYYQGTIFN